jgi:hypothetical protein
MTKTDKMLNLFGYHSKTRLFIIDCISKNGNHINKEDLIEKVVNQFQIQRQSVRWHLRNMLLRNEITINTSNISLKDPVNLIPSPFESWRIIGIPISIVLLLISFSEKNQIATIIATAFTTYSFAIHIPNFITYFKRIRTR